VLIQAVVGFSRMVWASAVFTSLFVPEGYPASVAPEYGAYQIWDTLQQLAYFAATIISLQALMELYGVGNPSANAAAAVALSIARRMIQDIVSLPIAFPPWLRKLCRVHAINTRFAAELLTAAGGFLDILAARYPSTVLPYVGPVVLQTGAVFGGMARAVLLQHFAVAQNNRDVVMKESNQDKAAKLVGAIIGAALLAVVGLLSGTTDKAHVPLAPSAAVFASLTFVHILGILGALRALPASLGNGAAIINADSVITYRGNILPSSGGKCIASFPGKYAWGWNAVVKEEHGMSVACVFLPEADAGLGKHVPDPENSQNACYCKQIYGERDFRKFGYLMTVNPRASAKVRHNMEKVAQATGAVLVEANAWPWVRRRKEAEARAIWEAKGRVASWGCLWFKDWKSNVHEAVDRGQRLVAYFFLGQKGMGKIPWDMLGHESTDPWDGMGLGGSQKCEVAYMERMFREGNALFELEEQDVGDFMNPPDQQPQTDGPWMGSRRLLPPGWPGSVPPGYLQYHVCKSVLGMLSQMIDLVVQLVLWVKVYGVGDAEKAPLRATCIFVFMSSAHSLAGIVLGLPVFASSFPDHQLPRCGVVLGMVAPRIITLWAAFVPMGWFIVLIIASSFLQAVGETLCMVASAQTLRIWSRSPNVDMTDIQDASKNQGTLANTIGGGASLAYAVYLAHAGGGPLPPIRPLLAALAAMLAALLFFSQGQARAAEQAHYAHDYQALDLEGET